MVAKEANTTVGAVKRLIQKVSSVVVNENIINLHTQRKPIRKHHSCIKVPKLDSSTKNDPNGIDSEKKPIKIHRAKTFTKWYHFENGLSADKKGD